MIRSSHSLDRLDTAFDDHRLVADAGLLLPATLAQHLGLKALVDAHLDLGDRLGAANVGDKFLTLVLSALAGGDCIDDADALRAGATSRVLGFTAKAASTLGTFLRSFRWGHVRQLDRVSRELLARAWSAGAGPGDPAGPLALGDQLDHRAREAASDPAARLTVVAPSAPLWGLAGACLRADARPRRAGLTVTMHRYAIRDVSEAGPC